MTFKVEVEGSPELQRTIELLKFYPEIADRHLYPAMQAAAEIVKQKIGPHVPVRTGHLLSALGSKVVHSGTAQLGTRAIIGFGKRYTNVTASYNGPLNEGAKAHDVTARRGEYLRFSSRGRFTAIKSMRHPGFSGRHYMEAGLEEAMPGIDAEMAKAAEGIVQELAS